METFVGVAQALSSANFPDRERDFFTLSLNYSNIGRPSLLVIVADKY